MGVTETWLCLLAVWYHEWVTAQLKLMSVSSFLSLSLKHFKI